MEVIYHEHQLESAIKEWPILDGYCIRRHHGRVLYLNLCGVAPEITGSQIVDAVRLVLMIPAAIGIISDPTTKGVQDSKLAMTYDAPKADEELHEKANKQNEPWFPNGSQGSLGLLCC